MIAATTRSTGITSTVPSGDAGELAEQAAGVGDDHRLGHAEAADPAGLRLGERRLDDRRPHDRDRHVALHVGQRLLAERLGERVGVGPADARGSGAPGLDELVLDPALAQLLRSSTRGRVLRPHRVRRGLRSGTARGARGSRLAASLSERRRRLAATSLRQSMPMSNGPSLTRISGALPRRLPAT